MCIRDRPTVVLTSNADFITMKEEIFGPLVTIFLYEDNKWTEILQIVDNTSKYALTGAVFSKDRYAIEEASEILQNSAGNFYINDKPTGALDSKTTEDVLNLFDKLHESGTVSYTHLTLPTTPYV